MSEQEQTFLYSLVPTDWLQGCEEAEAFHRLVSTFLLRVADSFRFNPKEHKDESLPDAIQLSKFQIFLDLAERRTGILPSWWSKDKRGAYENFVMCYALEVANHGDDEDDNTGDDDGNDDSDDDGNDCLNDGDDDGNDDSDDVEGEDYEETLITTFQDILMPTKLRLLGEKIYGTRAPVPW